MCLVVWKLCFGVFWRILCGKVNRHVFIGRSLAGRGLVVAAMFGCVMWVVVSVVEV